MTITTIASQAVLILTAAVLIYAAFADLKHFKIHNELIIVLIALFFLHAFLSGRWITLHWNLAFATLLFLIMLVFYAMKVMGGGDLKLLTVAILWVGPYCTLPFAFFLLLFICIHIVAVKFKLLKAQIVNEKKWLPFAPSIAAAVISVFIAGCLRPI